MVVVDDEPAVLSSVRRTLLGVGEIVVAQGGEAGLDAIAEHPDVAVVVSDMRMPGMDGAQFLAEVRDRRPEATRMMLTGYADLEATMRVVNDAGVFRFLLKPCPPPDLVAGVNDAIALHRAATAEKVLLEDTLRGAARVFADVAELANPEAMGLTARVREAVSAMVAAAPFDGDWKVELAALVEPIGAIMLPDPVLAKLAHGAKLDDQDRAMVAAIPKSTAELLAPIPRIDDVVRIVRGWPDWGDGDDVVARGRRILATAHGFADALARRGDEGEAVAEIQARRSEFPTECVDALSAAFGGTARPVDAVAIEELVVGSRIEADILDRNGTVLVTTGQAVSQALLERLRNFRQTSAGVVEPIMVRAPAPPIEELVA